MNGSARRLALLSLAPLVCWSAGAAASPPAVAIISLTSLRGQHPRELERLLAEVASSQRLSPRSSRQVMEKLDSPALRGSRQRAAALLDQAALLGQQVRYDEALRKLESAETAALEGLARLAEPELLSEIFFQRGVALLPTDQVTAQRYLVQSLILAPRRSLPRGTSPKIAQALRQAERQARNSSASPPTPAEGARAARLLEVRYLLGVDLRSLDGQEGVNLFRFDSQEEAWRGARAGWSGAAPQTEVRAALQEALIRLLPAPAAATATVQAPASAPLLATDPPRTSRRILPWVATALGAGLAIAGGTLLGLAGRDADEYQSLAGQSPLVEYGGRASVVEDRGRAYNTAGIVCLALAGATAVTAVVLWLLPSPSRRPAEPAAGSGWAAAEGGLRFSF